ncbi:hypothetical protein [Lentzea sp. NPDC092896]|uniref:hypothetical protein n=1 Tax=Lentzea sp. NPDC092896 TaxID=3364127 RepID=UPI00380C618D
MNRWILGIVGLVLCVAGLVALGLGLASDRGSRAALGAVGFIVFWYAGFFCFVGAS